MKKLLLSASALFVSMVMMSQSSASGDSKILGPAKYSTNETTAGSGIGRSLSPVRVGARGTSRSVTTIPIGTSGNPYGVINNNVNQVSYIAATNQVFFVHRTTHQIYLTDDANNSQYRYDVSRDGGASWAIDRGLLNPSGSQTGFACRFPNAVNYNPAGNTNPDSSYLNYIGSFHDGGSSADWRGYCYGGARLDNAPSTFSERRWEPNTSNTNIITGVCESVPGTFWGVDQFITTTDGTNPQGISVYKGTWNADSMMVVWTAPTVLYPPVFDLGADSKKHIISYTIAFDPSGANGWIAATGDLKDDAEYTSDPFFYHSTDGGSTWMGPIIIDLDSINGIVYDPINGPASTSFDISLTVDFNGNPHLATVVLPGSNTTPYSILGAAPDKYIYDITYDPSLSADCQWRAINLDYVNSLRKDVVTGQLTCDNYIRMSRTADGKKVFVTWVDTDSLVSGSANSDNDFPDFKLIGLDIENNKRTAVKNYTSSDVTWSGNVIWPTTSPIAKTTGSTNNIPTVFAKMNTQLVTPELDTCYFFYVQNIDVTDAEFLTNLDNTPPTITVIGGVAVDGTDSIAPVLQGSVYTDLGATAFDCSGGDLTSSIIVTGSINTATLGFDTIYYTVTDVAGNTATAVRVVRVITTPICTFDITPSNAVVRKFSFTYTNPSALATNWDWNYGDLSGVSLSTSGLLNHTYIAAGTYNVSFTARNSAGTCSGSCTIVINADNSGNVTCASVVTDEFTGINDVNLNNNIEVYPNPASDVVSVSLDLNASKNVNISIVNMLGAKVYSKFLGTVNGSTTEKIDVSNLEVGIYMVRIETEKGTAVKKLNISRR